MVELWLSLPSQPDAEAAVYSPPRTGKADKTAQDPVQRLTWIRSAQRCQRIDHGCDDEDFLSDFWIPWRRV